MGSSKSRPADNERKALGGSRPPPPRRPDPGVKALLLGPCESGKSTLYRAMFIREYERNHPEAAGAGGLVGDHHADWKAIIESNILYEMTARIKALKAAGTPLASVHAQAVADAVAELCREPGLSDARDAAAYQAEHMRHVTAVHRHNSRFTSKRMVPMERREAKRFGPQTVCGVSVPAPAAVLYPTDIQENDSSSEWSVYGEVDALSPVSGWTTSMTDDLPTLMALIKADEARHQQTTKYLSRDRNKAQKPDPNHQPDIGTARAYRT